MGNRTSGYGDAPNFSGVLFFHVQQERPDGTLWSVAFFLDDHEQFASRKFFATEAEARAHGNATIEAR